MRSRRRRCGHRWLGRLLFERRHPSADEKPVDEESYSDQEWDYPRQPYVANDLRVITRLSPRHDLEEVTQEDHHSDADQAGDDSAPDFIEPFLLGRLDFIEPFFFGRDTSSPFPLLFVEEHVRHPGLAPIELLFGGAGRHRIAHAAQIGATLPAEFEIIVGLKTASGTKHSNFSAFVPSVNRETAKM